MQELGAGRADHEQRDVSRPVDELIDEVEQRIVGPVQVFEDEDKRPRVGYGLEEAAPGGESLVHACRSLFGHADEGTKMALHPLRLRRIDREADLARELFLSLLAGVGVEDARLRLDDLREGPERHAVAVRDGPALPPA